MNAKALFALGAMLGVAVVLAVDSGLAGQTAVAEPQEVEAASTPITLYPIADAPITSLYPDWNLGSYHQLAVGRWESGDQQEVTRSLVQFDLGSICPGAGIDQARFQLWLVEPYGPPLLAITMRRIAESWSESAVTWNTRPGYSAHHYATSNVGTMDGYYTWDATELVRDWCSGAHENYGMMMISTIGARALRNAAVEIVRAGPSAQALSAALKPRADCAAVGAPNAAAPSRRVALA